MYLQLAERPAYLDYLSLTNTTRSNIKHQNFAEGRRKGRVSVGGYKRRSRVAPHNRRYPMLSETPNLNPHIFIPDFEAGQGGVFIREDKFDGMPDNQWAMFMRMIAPYQPEVQQTGMSENMYLADRASRRERRERKKEAKTAKKEARTKNKEDKNERKNKRRESKDEARKTRADAKKTKAEGGGGKFDWDKAKDVGGSLIGKFTGKGGDEETGGGDGSGVGPSGTGTNWKPLLIGLGITAVVAGGAYALTRRRTA